ncbi:MAG: sugar ABC transporter ATP-binding protein [Limnochordia bacterium]|jgi:simple sugar transport system ATP-binding protein
MADKYVLEVHNISKSYYGNQVLKNVSLQVRPGEIHGLVGENGAGKSTLMNILFGMEVIHSTGGYEGEIRIDGQPVQFTSPQEAMNSGIGMVHQEFMLLPNYTLAENIKLNRENVKPNFLSRILGPALHSLDYDKMNADARKALDTLGLDIEEYVTVAGLPVGYMQFTEIARELDKDNLKLLIFDEPTAVLAESEASHLLEAMKRIAARGIAILFITHRLQEIMEVCDHITVLRDGNHVATKAKSETNVYELAEMMVGSKVESLDRNQPRKGTDNVALRIENLTVRMPGERVNGLNLDVYKGEILGIGGLAGQGKIGVANGIMGLYPTTGRVLIDGQELPLNSPQEAMAHKLAYVSEDRRGVGLLLDSSIELNIALGAVQNQNRFLKKVGFGSLLDQRAIRAHALDMIKRLDIRCTGPTQIVRRLSGGNQQKVCIARALTMEPEILFVSEPTRGIDVGAKKLVLDTLVALNQELGMTIVMTSSELGELRSVCDRIAIVTEGKVAGILGPDSSDVDFGLLMSGQQSRKGA